MTARKLNMDYFTNTEHSLIEVDEALWRKGMHDGFGYGEIKMIKLIDLYQGKALRLGMYYDQEAIMAVYHQGVLDGQRKQDSLHGVAKLEKAKGSK